MIIIDQMLGVFYCTLFRFASFGTFWYISMFDRDLILFRKSRTVNATLTSYIVTVCVRLNQYGRIVSLQIVVWYFLEFTEWLLSGSRFRVFQIRFCTTNCLFLKHYPASFGT